MLRGGVNPNPPFAYALGLLYYSENFNWAAQNFRLGRELDIAGLRLAVPSVWREPRSQQRLLLLCSEKQRHE